MRIHCTYSRGEQYFNYLVKPQYSDLTIPVSSKNSWKRYYHDVESTMALICINYYKHGGTSHSAVVAQKREDTGYRSR